MANADYVISGEGGMCPHATLATALEPGDTEFTVLGVQQVEGEADLEVGMGVMINDEIMRVVAISLPNVEVARGCADTIPASPGHPANSSVWFFTRAAATDEVTYTATDTIAVKVLPYSLSDGSVPVSAAPPMDLTFNWRFSRPYPPGQVLMQGEPWHSRVFYLEDLEDEFTLTWVHRDRLLQADQLIGHEEASIGPEDGTTYTIRVYDSADTLVRTASGIAGTTWSYDRVDVETEVPEGVGRITLSSVRDGLESWQSYTVYFLGADIGFGMSFGLFGG